MPATCLSKEAKTLHVTCLLSSRIPCSTVLTARLLLNLSVHLVPAQPQPFTQLWGDLPVGLAISFPGPLVDRDQETQPLCLPPHSLFGHIEFASWGHLGEGAEQMELGEPSRNQSGAPRRCGVSGPHRPQEPEPARSSPQVESRHVHLTVGNVWGHF